MKDGGGDVLPGWVPGTGEDVGHGTVRGWRRSRIRSGVYNKMKDNFKTDNTQFYRLSHKLSCTERHVLLSNECLGT